MEGDPRRVRLPLEVGVVGDHRHHVSVELAPAPAPEQLDQTVVLARDENGDALALAPVADLPLHREAICDLGLEALLEALALLGEVIEEDLHPQVEPAPVGSEEYWSEETMFAPSSKRKPDTAATMPGRSSQSISRRALKR